MKLTVREMTMGETDLVIDYFHHSTPEHLDLMGVDPTRLPTPRAWRDRYASEFGLPLNQRTAFPVIWLAGDEPIGFSTADKIVYGERANMHLHVVEPERRGQGLGAECMRRTVEIYFRRLKLKVLICEPNAFNIAPNRTLQKAGFRYVKTHFTVPGPLNYHQAVTRWVIES